MIDRFEQFSYLISSIYGDIQKIERDEMVKYGAKGVYAQYLVAMRRYPEGVTAAQLCEICDKDKAAVSRAVTDMERNGLVMREGTGGYRALVKLTNEGKQAAEYVCEKAVLAVELAGLTEEKRKVFYEALQLIASNLKTITREGLPGIETHSEERCQNHG